MWQVPYIETLKFRCPPLTNPADFFMDITSVDYRNGDRESNSRGRVSVFSEEAERRKLGSNAAAAALAGVTTSKQIGPAPDRDGDVAAYSAKVAADVVAGIAVRLS